MNMSRTFRQLVLVCAGLALMALPAAALDRRGELADGLDPIAAGLVDHVGNGALDFGIGEIGIAAVRGHFANALERSASEAGETLGRELRPRLSITDFRGTTHACPVTDGAHRLHDFLAAALTLLRARHLHCGWHKTNR